MPPITDPVQEVIEACVEVLDTHSSIVALTGRASRNVVPLEDLTTARSDTLPAIGFSLISAGPGRGALGDWRRVVLQFDAEAETRRKVGEILQAVRAAVNAVNLQSNSNHPIDSYIIKGAYTEQRFGFLVPEDDPDAFRSAIQVTLDAVF